MASQLICFAQPYRSALWSEGFLGAPHYHIRYWRNIRPVQTLFPNKNMIIILLSRWPAHWRGSSQAMVGLLRIQICSLRLEPVQQAKNPILGRVQNLVLVIIAQKQKCMLFRITYLVEDPTYVSFHSKSIVSVILFIFIAINSFALTVLQRLQTFECDFKLIRLWKWCRIV